MHRKAILIIAAVTLLTFGNSLGNGFVGDDDVVIVRNAFYTSWKNFPRLFARDYLTDSDTVFNFKGKYFHSGSVAYRPVLSATFFIDHWIWELNPFGYHLHNLLLHAGNGVLVYFMVFLILENSPLALLSALLFAVHPFKTEAVCAIGYRADILAAFFFLVSFLSYIHHHRHRKLQRAGWIVLSYAAFFLALFTKESAIIYLGIVAAYDFLVRGEKISGVMKRFFSTYLGFLGITAFYLYTYLFLFPNFTLIHAPIPGGSGFGHVWTMLRILSSYVTGFFLPFAVKTLPPGYVPNVHQPADLAVPFAVIVMIGIVYFLVRIRGYRKEAVFFFVWFFLSLIPVSNIIPITNPMAYRFMYLPSVGFLALLAVFGDRVCFHLGRISRDISWDKMTKLSWVMACMAATISLNTTWRNNFVMASHMIRDYPRSWIGYMYLGMEYYKGGDIEEVKTLLLKADELGLDDPRGFYLLGLCFSKDLERAKSFYEKSIRLFPNYVLSYVGLGRAYVLQGAYEQAVPYLTRGIELEPLYSAYGYLIESYIGLGRLDEARTIYENARTVLTDKGHVDSLFRMIQESPHLKIPIDIGI